MADDADERKMFVGGLAQQVTEDDLTELFSQFGTIAELKLMMDQMTGRSRGFAFVTFESAESVLAAVSAGPHSLKGKEINTKKAGGKQVKVYVGKIPEDGPGEVSTGKLFRINRNNLIWLNFLRGDASMGAVVGGGSRSVPMIPIYLVLQPCVLFSFC